MDFGLKGARAAVAAATSGLGFAVAREFLAEGASVAICGRSEERVRDAVARLGEAACDGATARGVAVDLDAPEGPRDFLDFAAREGAVEILVANNGGPPPGPSIGLGKEAWESGFRRSFDVSRELAEGAIAGMQQAGRGRIIFITSVSVKQPVEGLAISTAMRAGLVGYAKMLADELAPDGITVNCLAPGMTRTPRVESLFRARAEASGRSLAQVEADAVATIPAGRIAEPEEFAAVAAFLASRRASYLTGTVIQVDGGWVRSLS